MRPFAAANAVEGAFVFVPEERPNDVAIYATMTAGPDALVGGPGGVAVGRFGFAHADGRVTNAREADTDRRGFVVLPFQHSPTQNDWRRNFFDAATNTYRIREGTEVVMCTRGVFWARFEGGAWPAQPVYADPLDGKLISGYALGAELTRWSVVTRAGPGELAVISTSVQVGAL